MAKIEDDGTEERKNVFEQASNIAYDKLATLRRAIEKGETPNHFADARKLMSRRFRTDEELRNAYLANITMMIQDCQSPQYFHIGDGEVIGTPLDLSNSQCCDALAERLLKLIFDS